MHHVPPRFHIWNDDDKMLLAIGPKEGGLYGYSAAGDRPYKLTGKCEITSVNGGSLTYELQLDDAVIYPNPYLTITPYGYFKHYFAGTERVATVRGNIHLHEWIDAPLTAPTPREHYIKELLRNPATFLSYDDCCSNEYAGKPTDNADYNGNSQQQLQYQENRVLLTALNLKFDENPILERIEDNIPEEEELYFYHPDHLGSASWITDHNGNPVQYLQYAPYGEITLDQHPFGYQERFKFTGKELDKETGYFYFGARSLESYYITGFTSVDPLADKYIGTQSYAYCNGNPVGLKDPDGKDIYRYDNGTGDFYLYKKTDDNFDQIGMFKHNRKTGEYEPRRNKDGSIKTYTDHRGNNGKLAKGILREGLNIKQNGAMFISDNHIGPTIDDYYNFALILDEVAGVEISGFVLEAPFEKNKKIVRFESYKKNSIDRSRTSTMNFTPYNVLQHFHTHGHAGNYTEATTPSKYYDIPAKFDMTNCYPGIQLLILHNYGAPIKY